MITKNDAILLITDIQNSGVNCQKALETAISEPSVSLKTLKFINDNRQLDLTSFYEKLRKSYNDNHSKLYKNIVDYNVENSSEILNTLNSYALQVTIFSSKVENKQLFFKFARLEEVYRCLHYYSKTFDLIPCVKILNLLKADIKALEEIYRKK